MASDSKQLSCSDYHVAWICPVADVELLPARLMLDEEHNTPPYNTHYDENTYICGAINGHAVVIATCPHGETGNVNAGRLTGPMFKTFPNIRMAVLVGIGGGIPRPVVLEDALENLHLGDVVVGWPGDGKPACVYHDRGRSKADGQFELVSTMQSPDWRLTNALSILVSDHEMGKTTFDDQLARLQYHKKRRRFAHPGPEHDRLFRATYRHIGDYSSICIACNQSELVHRPQRTEEDMQTLVFHLGRIATGNTAIQDGELRDEIRARCDGALCVEMGAAGVDANRRCLVVRGISDYADSHKSDIWRSYAAGNAAAFTRALLCRVQPDAVKEMEGIMRTKNHFSPTGSYLSVASHPNSASRPTIDRINAARHSTNQSVPCQSFNPLLNLQDSFFRKSRNQNFTGRVSELRRITDFLSGHTIEGRQGPLRVVVHGLGGVGKTQLVTEYCHRLHEQFRTSIFWFTASSLDKLESQYKEQAQSLCKYARSYNANKILKDLVKVHRHPGSETDLVKEWIASHPDWLLVMDNFDNISIDVDKFIPPGAGGKVIFTSRDRRSIGHVAQDGFELTSPKPSDAGLIFLRLCNNKKENISSDDLRNHPENIQIERIVESLESFPLALSQAAAYIRLNDPFTCAEYLELLTDQIENREVLLRFKAENPDYPESVMTTWEISLDFLKKSYPQAAELLQLLGFFFHSNIPLHILHRATEVVSWRFGTYKGHRRLDDEQRNQLTFLQTKAEFGIRLSLLVSLSLVSKDISSIPTISVHPLVHEWIRTRLKPNLEELARLANLSGLVVYQAYPLNIGAGFVEWTATDTKESMNNLLHPHLLQVLYNIHHYEPHSLSTPIEVRALFLAALLSQIARSGPCGEFERRLVDFYQTYTSNSSAVIDSLGDLQKRLVETLGNFEFPLSCESWLQAAKGLESCLSSPFQITEWSHGTAIYIVVFVSLVVAITDKDPRTRHGFISISMGTTNQNADDIALESRIKDYKVSILQRVLDFLSIQGENVPDEILFLQTVVKGRLGDILTAEQYEQLQWPFLADGLHSKCFAHIGISTAVAYFNRCICFYRRSNSKTHLQVLTSVIQLFTEAFKNSDLKYGNRSGIHSSTKISSSFGRSGPYGVLDNSFLQRSDSAPRPTKLAREIESFWVFLRHSALECIDDIINEQQLLIAKVEGQKELVPRNEKACDLLDALAILQKNLDDSKLLPTSKSDKREIEIRYARIQDPCSTAFIPVGATELGLASCSTPPATVTSDDEQVIRTRQIRTMYIKRRPGIRVKMKWR